MDLDAHWTDLSIGHLCGQHGFDAGHLGSAQCDNTVELLLLLLLLFGVWHCSVPTLIQGCKL